MAEQDLDALGAALATYRVDTGHYPTTAEGFAALMTRPASLAHPPSRRWPDLLRRWRGPYLLRQVPRDPWGAPYVYQRDDGSEGERYRLSTYGADGRPGGFGYDADVVVRH